jgi:inhibitor of growth protein 3
MMVRRASPHLHGSPKLTYFIIAANLPAEIAHLYEEAMAKQESINECNAIIANRDSQLQKWVKLSGSLVPHPKEDAFNKAILDAFDRAQLLQDEKVALMEKAGSLVGVQKSRVALLSSY